MAIVASPAAAEPAVGVVNGANLIATLDTTAPGTVTGLKQITGLRPGERIVGIDFRNIPQTTLSPLPAPRLFAVGAIPGAVDSVLLYTLDFGTGVATPVAGATPFNVTSGNAYGVDFNPTVDRIRVLNNGDENFRISPNNGARADTPTNDTDLNLAGNQIAAMAYDRVNIATPPALAANTTLYGISVANSSRVTIGGINQSPSPNGGNIQNSLPLGITLAGSSAATTNMDISFAGIAYATLTNNATGIPALYTINLSTGAATLIGSLAVPLGGFTIVPAASTQFAAESMSQPESAGPATITVSRSGSLASTATVDYATSDGTATAAGDYVPVAGKLSFAPDETSKTFDVPIVADGVNEPDESVNLTLSSSSFPMSLGSPSTSRLTILDKKAPTVQLEGAPSTIKLKSFLKGIKLSITPSEAAELQAELLGTVTRAGLRAFNLSLASDSLELAAGTRTIKLKPSHRLVGKPKKKFKVRLLVTATDAAGNAQATKKTITVKPGR